MKSRWPWAVAFAAALRLYDLGGQEFWTDEAIVLQAARWPWRTFVAYFAVDPHPPLFYLLVRGLATCGVHGEFGLRLISALAGTATVAILAWLLARRFGEAPALAGGLLMAVNPLHVWASQELRGMALAGFFVTAAAAVLESRTPAVTAEGGCATQRSAAEGGCATRTATGGGGCATQLAAGDPPGGMTGDPPGRPYGTAAAVLALAAGCYTHYYALLALPVFAVASRAGRRAAIGAALLFAPWLPIVVSQARAAFAFRAAAPFWRNLVETIIYANAGHFPWHWPTWAGLLDGLLFDRSAVYIAVALLLTAPVFALAASTGASRKLAAAWAAPAALALGASTLAPVFSPKYLAIFAPFLGAAAGVGFWQARARRPAAAMILLAAALLAPAWSLLDLYGRPPFRKPTWRRALSPLIASYTADDRLLFYCASDAVDARLYWTGPSPAFDLFAEFAAARAADVAAVRTALQPLAASRPARVAVVDVNGELFPAARAAVLAALTDSRGAPQTIQVQPAMGIRLLLFGPPRTP